MQNQIRKEYAAIQNSHSLAALAVFYNRYSSTKVNRFSSVAAAHKRIAALIDELDPLPAKSSVLDPLADVMSDDEAPAVAAKKPPKLHDVYKAPAIQQSEKRIHRVGTPTANAIIVSTSSKKAEVLATIKAKPAIMAGLVASATASLKDEARRKMSDGQRESWKVPEIREKRCERSAVMVDKQQFKSVPEAFRVLGLPMSKCIAFRMRLKEEGVIKAEYGHNWEIVPINY